jgi:hypothetical protein
MRLKFDFFDGRKWCTRDVIDEETGKVVGYIRSNGTGFENYGGIDIELFDGKYLKVANSYKECFGFVMGVQAVLNHLTTTTNYTAKSDKAA